MEKLRGSPLLLHGTIGIDDDDDDDDVYRSVIMPTSHKVQID
jgi:hypothetical protein